MNLLELLPLSPLSIVVFFTQSTVFFTLIFLAGRMLQKGSATSRRFLWFWAVMLLPAMTILATQLPVVEMNTYVAEFFETQHVIGTLVALGNIYLESLIQDLVQCWSKPLFFDRSFQQFWVLASRTRNRSPGATERIKHGDHTIKASSSAPTGPSSDSPSEGPRITPISSPMSGQIRPS